MIYYIDNGKVLEIDSEMSGVPQYDLLLNFDNLKGWTIPKNEPFAFIEQTAIKEKLLEWLNSKRIKTYLVWQRKDDAAYIGFYSSWAWLANIN